MTLPSSDEISAAIQESSAPEAHDYAAAFRKRHDAQPEMGWDFLHQLFNFHFRSENASEPFGPMMIMEGKRTAIPDDFSEQDLKGLKTTLEQVGDPEYQARVADVLWLRLRKPEYARLAVSAYLASGKKLEDPQHWTQCMERYERALRLARQIEPKGELPKEILGHLQERIFHYDGADPLYFTSKAIELLTEFKFGDFERLAGIANKVAVESRKNGDFRRARTYYENQAKLLKLAKDTGAVERALVESAECFFEEAEAREAAGEFMAAHSIWSDAIREFRNRPSLRSRVPDIQKRYSDTGKKVLEEMKSVSSDEIDISEYVKQSKEAVTGLNWDDAFFTFVTFVPLIKTGELRKQAEKQIGDHPLQSMMDTAIYDAAGRKIGIRPSAHTDDPQQYELAIEGFMEQNASIHRDISIQANIAPMMRQILIEHDVSKDEVAELLGDSALLPEDRKDWFFEAFAAGFAWDFSTALHVLIPQIENALRHVLQQHDVTPSNVDAQGIEEVWGLERILAHDKLKEVIGEDFIFELRSLLVGRLGPNYRNLFAHGLLSPDAMQTGTSLYLWWVIMRLAAFPTSGMQAFVERKRALKEQQ